MKTWSWRTCATAIAAALMLPGVSDAANVRDVEKRNSAAPAVTYAVRVGGAGEMVLAADAGVLQIEKSVFEDGRTTLVLKSDRDEVTIALDRNGATAVSGDSRVSVDAAQPDEAAFGRTRALLAQSKAARLFRDLTAAIERRGEPLTPYEQLLFLSTAEVARVEGDTTAVESFARRLGFKKVRPTSDSARLRPASCDAGLRRVQFTDCLTGWELALLGAYRSWNYCYYNTFNNVPWYWRYQELWLCDIEYYFRAEQYAFQMLRCMAVP